MTPIDSIARPARPIFAVMAIALACATAAASPQEESWQKLVEEAVFARSYGTQAEGEQLVARALAAAEASGDPGAIDAATKVLVPTVQDEYERCAELVASAIVSSNRGEDFEVELSRLGRPIDVALALGQCLDGKPTTLGGIKVQLPTMRAWELVEDVDNDAEAGGRLLIAVARDQIPSLEAVTLARLVERFDRPVVSESSVIDQLLVHPDRVVRELAFESLTRLDEAQLRTKAVQAKLLQGVENETLAALDLLLEYGPLTLADTLVKSPWSSWLTTQFTNGSDRLQYIEDTPEALATIVSHMLDLAEARSPSPWSLDAVSAVSRVLTSKEGREVFGAEENGRALALYRANEPTLDSSEAQRACFATILRETGSADLVLDRAVGWVRAGTLDRDALEDALLTFETARPSSIDRFVAVGKELAELAVLDGRRSSDSHSAARTFWEAAGASDWFQESVDVQEQLFTAAEGFGARLVRFSYFPLAKAATNNPSFKLTASLEEKLSELVAGAGDVKGTYRISLARILISRRVKNSAALALAVARHFPLGNDNSRKSYRAFLTGACAVHPEAARSSILAALGSSDVPVPRVTIEVEDGSATWNPNSGGVAVPFAPGSQNLRLMPVGGFIKPNKVRKTVQLPSLICVLPDEQRVLAAHEVLSGAYPSDIKAQVTEALLFEDVTERGLDALHANFAAIEGSELRARVIDAMGEAVHRPSRETIAEALSDHAPEVRRAALRAANSFVVLQRSIEALRPVVGRAANAGLQGEAKSGTQRLIELALDESTEVAVAALQALSTQSTPEALAAVVESVGSDRAEVREAAKSALMKMTRR